jgi:hypothetical protein
MDYMTEEEIAKEIVTNRLDDETKAYIKNIAFEDVGSLHHGFGTWIRNTFGLWERPAWTPVIIDDVDHAEDHPDEISFRIIQLVHDKLNGK